MSSRQSNSTMRCPECRSEIPDDATRCRYCRALVDTPEWNSPKFRDRMRWYGNNFNKIAVISFISAALLMVTCVAVFSAMGD